MQSNENLFESYTEVHPLIKRNKQMQCKNTMQNNNTSIVL